MLENIIQEYPEIRSKQEKEQWQEDRTESCCHSRIQTVAARLNNVALNCHANKRFDMLSLCKQKAEAVMKVVTPSAAARAQGKSKTSAHTEGATTTIGRKSMFKIINDNIPEKCRVEVPPVDGGCEGMEIVCRGLQIFQEIQKGSRRKQTLRDWRTLLSEATGFQPKQHTYDPKYQNEEERPNWKKTYKEVGEICEKTSLKKDSPAVNPVLMRILTPVFADWKPPPKETKPWILPYERGLLHIKDRETERLLWKLAVDNFQTEFRLGGRGLNGRMFVPRHYVANTPVTWNRECQKSAEDWAAEMFKKNGRSGGTYNHKSYFDPEMTYHEIMAKDFFTLDQGKTARHRLQALIDTQIGFYNEGVCYRYGYTAAREPGCTVCWRQNEEGCSMCSRAATFQGVQHYKALMDETFHIGGCGVADIVDKGTPPLLATHVVCHYKKPAKIPFLKHPFSREVNSALGHALAPKGCDSHVELREELITRSAFPSEKQKKDMTHSDQPAYWEDDPFEHFILGEVNKVRDKFDVLPVNWDADLRNFAHSRGWYLYNRHGCIAIPSLPGERIDVRGWTGSQVLENIALMHPDYFIKDGRKVKVDAEYMSLAGVVEEIVAHWEDTKNCYQHGTIIPFRHNYPGCTNCFIRTSSYECAHCTDTYNGPYPFVQMVHEKITHMGCSDYECDTKSIKGRLIICMFGGMDSNEQLQETEPFSEATAIEHDIPVQDRFCRRLDSRRNSDDIPALVMQVPSTDEDDDSDTNVVYAKKPTDEDDDSDSDSDTNGEETAKKT
eukprot:GHVQ01001496.1.p1 GENE.GHVQ01001496.1~~GHVQ01001496.1.p1  ORF type:complete len:781 (+),score=69.66 GHVQ01001496.1:700-3042(+)